jgi:hypothetical protein
LIVIFGLKTYSIVKANAFATRVSPVSSGATAAAAGAGHEAPPSPPGGHNTSHSSNGHAVWSTVTTRTLLLLAIYAGSFIGNVILAMLNAGGVVGVPVEVEIVSSWMTKVVIIHSSSFIATLHVCRVHRSNQHWIV